MMTTGAATPTDTVDTSTASSRRQRSTPTGEPADSTQSSVSVADRSGDAAALVWDLTVHQIRQAFAWSVRPLSDSADEVAVHLARVRIAAARHAVADINASLHRMTEGMFGTCEQCGRAAAAEPILQSPAIRCCSAYQLQRPHHESIPAPSEAFP